jgi:uncharacterized membrane protein
MIWLRLIHILSGIVWVGSALFITVFLLPAARREGADARRFLGRLMPRVGPLLGVTALLTIVSGGLMFRTWAGSRAGMVYGVGALAALLAAVIGTAFGARANAAMGRLRAAIESQGGAPTAGQTADLASIEGRQTLVAAVAATLLIIAAGAMAIARYV